MSFLNLRITGRLYGGFGALLLFCAALAGFAVWQLSAIHTQVGSLTLQSKNAIRVGEITTELQATRRSLLRYAFDQDEASFAEAEKRLSKTAELLEVAAKTTMTEERRAAYKAALPEITELKTKRLALGEAVKQMLAGRNLLFVDELYYKAITPVIMSTIGKMDDVKASIGQAFEKTTTETEDRISNTTQEMVAGAAVLTGLLIAFFIAR